MSERKSQPRRTAKAAAAPVKPVTHKPAKPAVLKVTAKATPVTAAKTSAPSVLKETETMTDTIAITEKMSESAKAAGKAATDKAQAAFADFSVQAKAAFEKSSKIMEDMTDLTKGNIEAVVVASRAAAKNTETLTQTAADFSRRSFEEATKALKTMSAAKTPTEFFNLQNDFAKAQFDKMISESSKMSELMVKMFGDVMEPLSTRASVAADKVKASFA